MSLSCTVFEILTLINLRIRGSTDRQINAIAAPDVGRHCYKQPPRLRRWPLAVTKEWSSSCATQVVVLSFTRSTEMKSKKSLKRIGSQKPAGRRACTKRPNRSDLSIARFGLKTVSLDLTELSLDLWIGDCEIRINRRLISSINRAFK